jgi:5-formyltetrahydrofolate cyclo-ligase
MTLPEQKAEVRIRMKAALREISPTARAADSECLVARCREWPTWESARSVLLFYPLGDEPEVTPLIPAALAAGKTIALPRFRPDLGAYEAARLESLQQLTPPARFGVREPEADCPALPLKQLDLVLVPGIAFDVFGRRLGRGKGFYDRLLTGFSGIKCGVAFDVQVLPTLPAEPHDVTLNCLLTPTRRLEFPAAPRL